MKRVAIVGFGFIGKVHAVNILKNKNVELIAIVDKNIDAIEKELNSKTGNFSTGEIDKDTIKEINKYAEFDLCLEKEQLDAVHICVHTAMHYEFAKKTLMRGVNVLIEKPFTLNIKEGEVLIQLAKQKGLLLMVAHVVRFMPPYQKLKEWVENKNLGALKFLSLTRFSGTPQWGDWKEKQIDFGSSGGALFDFVLHDIDFAIYLTGKNPYDIQSKTLKGRLSNNDYINAVWSFEENNLTVKIEGGNIFHSEFPFNAGFMAQFEKGSVVFNTSDLEFIIVADNDKITKIPAGDLNDGYYNEIEYFYNCLETKSELVLCTPESSLTSIKLCYKHIQ